MSAPIVALFDPAGAAGATWLAYHLGWILSDTGQRVLLCDLDPRAGLTAMLLDEARLEALWTADGRDGGSEGDTVFRCVEPVVAGGDPRAPRLEAVTPDLRLVAGDLQLFGLEDAVSAAWRDTAGTARAERATRTLAAFWTVMRRGAEAMDATIVLADIGAGLGAVNRAALIAADLVLFPLSADLFSLQGLRIAGPALAQWRAGWRARRVGQGPAGLPLPDGAMRPAGYVLRERGGRIGAPPSARSGRMGRIPEMYARHALGKATGPFAEAPKDDAHCLAVLPPYRSLTAMAEESRKPLFHLTASDGAMGSHASAVVDARRDFRALATAIATRAGLT